MHLVLRAVPLAFGSLLIVFGGRAQPAELPAIFAPRPSSISPRPFGVAAPRATPSAVSDRVRSLINTAATQTLDQAGASETSTATASTYVDAATGATVMSPMIVRGQALQESQVRPPDLRLYYFTPLGGDKYRRIAGGATAALYHTYIGSKEFQVDLSILNAAGRGIDHNIDFTRAEIAFTLKW
jgi:hypothetical protein